MLIPAGNIDHLMLERRVIDAVAAGSFHIYPVRTVDEGMSLLTGVVAGVADAEGVFPDETINGLVEKRLRAFAKARRRRDRLPEDGEGEDDKP